MGLLKLKSRAGVVLCLACALIAGSALAGTRGAIRPRQAYVDPSFLHLFWQLLVALGIGSLFYVKRAFSLFRQFQERREKARRAPMGREAKAKKQSHRGA